MENHVSRAKSGLQQKEWRVHNKNNFNQTDGEVQEFVDRAFASDIGTLWSGMHPVETNTSSHFFEQCKEVDNYLFEARHTHGPQYGQYLI